jgi:hypothetical protein
MKTISFDCPIKRAFMKLLIVAILASTGLCITTINSIAAEPKRMPDYDGVLADKVEKVAQAIAQVKYPVIADDFIRTVSESVRIEPFRGQMRGNKITENYIIVGSDSPAGYVAVQMEMDRAGEGRKVVDARVIFKLWSGSEYRAYSE